MWWNMQMVRDLLSLLWLVQSIYPSGLPRCHWDNVTIGLLPVMSPRTIWMWVNTCHESTRNSETIVESKFDKATWPWPCFMGHTAQKYGYKYFIKCVGFFLWFRYLKSMCDISLLTHAISVIWHPHTRLHIGWISLPAYWHKGGTVELLLASWTL